MLSNPVLRSSSLQRTTSNEEISVVTPRTALFHVPYVGSSFGHPTPGFESPTEHSPTRSRPVVNEPISETRSPSIDHTWVDTRPKWLILVQHPQFIKAERINSLISRSMIVPLVVSFVMMFFPPLFPVAVIIFGVSLGILCVSSVTFFIRNTCNLIFLYEKIKVRQLEKKHFKPPKYEVIGVIGHYNTVHTYAPSYQGTPHNTPMVTSRDLTPLRGRVLQYPSDAILPSTP